MLAVISVSIWIALRRSRSDRRLHLRDASLSNEELEDHAKKIALVHTVSNRANILNWPVPRMNENYDFILAVYKGLNEDVHKKRTVPPVAEWLLDNFYMIEEQVSGLRRDLTRKNYLRLPVLMSGPFKGYARIFAVAVEFVKHTDGQFDETTLADYLKAYQSHSVLFDREIWAIPMVIRLALVENIRQLCESIKNTQIQWHKADEIIDSWLAAEGADTERVVKSLKDSLKTMHKVNPSFVEHLFFRLRRSGRSYVNVLRVMDENLAKFGETTEDITQKEHGAQSISTVSMRNCITSFHLFATMDWSDLFQSASMVEEILHNDPDGTYPQMDLTTRNYYRSNIEEMAIKFGVSELHIAREAIELASYACSAPITDSLTDAEIRRTWHVGYYLIGQGRKILESRQDPVKALWPRILLIGRNNPGILYLGAIGLVTLLLAALAVVYALMTAGSARILLAILAGLAILVPASEIAVNIVNRLVCKIMKPAVFPRLELKEGIPESLSTIVAVPTLLSDVKRVQEMLDKMECHYLSNREEYLYFALIGAFRDSDQEGMKDDERIIAAAIDGVQALNRKYAATGPDKFYFFHRASQFNESNQKWIGWERKRGALMEFNDLVLGSTDTSFTYQSSETPPFKHVKYIITLDSDTILPLGMARQMVGTMAHPLNRPVIDRQTGLVAEGYGLMQPRIDVDSDSSNQSLFSRIFTGQEGLDPYANAISDVYQDLFGEGIYTGKGIYDLQVFQSVLKQAIPENAILSHDLLEGSYVRTGLVTDLKLVDSYPSKYNSFASRLHRWVRGDWQLAPFLFKTITLSSDSRIANPLSKLSRWKMLDNLRRSIVPPALMLLAALSFSILPGNIFVWLGFLLVAQAFPLILALIGSIFSGGKIGRTRIKRYTPVMFGLKTAGLQSLLTLAFLPYQAWLMLDAIGVTLARVFITRQNLLEWVTSADVEKSQKNSLRSYLVMMKSSLITAPIILLLAIAFHPAAILVGLPFLLLWTCAPWIAYGISQDEPAASLPVTEADRQELGRIARKTWRYFEEFANAKSNYLAPDNYQADPPKGVAYRTSPTNIGLGLLANLSARDLGYIPTSGLVALIDKSVTTLEKMDKWNGHLYNWYDTHTLKPLRPAYISTVDSGNLACYLVTLQQGLLGYLRSPLVDNRFANGLRDTLLCAGPEGLAIYEKIPAIHLFIDQRPVDASLWSQILHDLAAVNRFASIKHSVWRSKTENMIRLFQQEMTELMPALAWLASLPADLAGQADTGSRAQSAREKIAPLLKDLVDLLQSNARLQDLPTVYRQAADLNGRMIAVLTEEAADDFPAGLVWLNKLAQVLDRAGASTGQLILRCQTLVKRIHNLSADMKFLPLYDKKKQLFSIGFNLEENRLTDSYYDLLASEARQTSYLCIARGEIPPTHWFKMGRALTVVDRYKGLVSWTGTMFEYLMPLLIMRSYKNTLLDETYSFVIKSQKKYGRQRNMPWGTSESGFNSLDVNHEYQYKAIGVPWLGLKRGLIEDAVTAPYATFLALLVDPEGAIKNIEHLKTAGLDGAYGFYEAADYTPERLQFEAKRTVVKSFMAHHQGMSLLALNNYLNEQIMQARFSSDPAIYAARLLLQEKVPANFIFAKDTREKVLPYKEVTTPEVHAVRSFSQPDPILPKAHILSNGNYSIMLTDRGTGYSKNPLVAITRWRADSTLDPYGMFFYLRNVDTNAVWSATYSPINVMPEHYEVVFKADKATYKRTDGLIKTETEVIVTSGDNAEIRRISLRNTGDRPCTLELTSYFEVVLATQAADIAHPAFSNLFIETAFHADKKCLVAYRRPRSKSDKSLWVGHAVVLEAEVLGDIQYETDRSQFLGRSHDGKAPQDLERGKPLSNSTGPVLDPVMSLRVSVKIEPGKTAVVSFVTAISENDELLLALIDKYASSEAVAGAFRLALTRSLVESRYLNLDATAMELFQDMISDILFISPLRRMDQATILQNRQGQSSLWRYGISGDRPIILVTIRKAERVDILYEILKAHEYWRLKDLHVDLVILSGEAYSYRLPLHDLISDIVLSSQTHDVLRRPGDVFILDQNKIPAEDAILLHAAARFVLTSDGRSMAEQMLPPTPPTLPGPKSFTSPAREYNQPEAPEPERQFFNGLGGFSQQGQEYHMTLEQGQATPAPWVNVIANPRFGFLVSESGSGYTWSENSRENKLTPWRNDAVSDSPGEVLYLGDGETGQHWTVSALPVREVEPYTIRHGFGYSVFEHASHGLEQKLTQFVPVDESIKISILSLTNTADHQRHLTLTYYVRPVLGVSDQVTAQYIRTSLSPAGALLIENPYNEEFAGQVGFIDVSIPLRTVTSDRREFFCSGDIGAPDCLSREALSGAVGTGFDPCAALQVHVTIEPGASRDIVFLFGVAGELSAVEPLTRKYRDLAQAQAALREVQAFWRSKLDIVQVRTPAGSLDLLLDGWLAYQVIVCRLWARSGFYQSGGAFGFRDQLQDSLAITHLWPEITRSQILRHARHQFTQGDVQHWWHEPQGKGTRTHFSDDLLWLPYVTAEYIRITGDHQILAETGPFLDEPVLADTEDERYGRPQVTRYTASLYDHCIRAVEHALKFGGHGLPLMGTGDWNDGMNTVGNCGLGESVWLGWFLATVLEKFSACCLAMGDAEKASQYVAIKTQLATALEDNAWDGSWYRRAYFDNGQPLGSIQNSDCKIDSIAQSWAVISGLGNPQRAVQAMNSLEDYLISRDAGLIKLLTPPFDEGDSEPGYIKGYVPGVRENGGQYTHAAAWVIMAFAKLGDGDKASELFELINPINHTSNLREAARYKVEPYVMAADVYTVHPHIGRGGWTWYTGSAGWMYRAGLESILGFQKNGDILIMDPCIPRKWRTYVIQYQYLTSRYDITVSNPEGLNQGVRQLTIDGAITPGNRLSLVDDGQAHVVDVLMGSPEILITAIHDPILPTQQAF